MINVPSTRSRRRRWSLSESDRISRSRMSSRFDIKALSWARSRKGHARPVLNSMREWGGEQNDEPSLSKIHGYDELSMGVGAQHRKRGSRTWEPLAVRRV